MTRLRKTLIVVAGILFVATLMSTLLRLYSPYHAVRSVQLTTACTRSGSACVDAILYDGLITRDGVRQLKALLAASGRRAVCFNSQGGEHKAGRELIDLIEGNRLTTCLADVYRVDSPIPVRTPTSCLSLCAYAFVSGFEPVIHGASDVWVHRTGFWLFQIFPIDIPDSWFRASIGFVHGDRNAPLPPAAQYLFEQSLNYPFSDYRRMRVISGEELLERGFISKIER